VAGIGNIFLGDDGFGCEVARELARRPPPDVKVVDYGIRGLDLAYALLEPYETVVLVDAVSRGETPGTIYILEPVLGQANQTTPLNPHSMEPAQLLPMAESLGEISARVFIVGCEPQSFGEELEGRMGLSQVVAASVGKAADVVREIVERVREPSLEKVGTIASEL
jgi:hydrogenase maturation protease